MGERGIKETNELDKCHFLTRHPQQMTPDALVLRRAGLLRLPLYVRPRTAWRLSTPHACLLQTAAVSALLCLPKLAILRCFQRWTSGAGRFHYGPVPDGLDSFFRPRNGAPGLRPGLIVADTDKESKKIDSR